MADWVHCNTCFCQPGQSSGKKKFYLTNCGHIYCDGCLDESTREKCKMCNAKCTSMALSAKMKPEVEIFFSAPSDLAKKLSKVIEFQKSHRKRLNSYLRERVQRERSTCEQSIRHLQQQEIEMQKMKEENIYLKKLLGDTSGSSSRGSGSKMGAASPYSVKRVSPGGNHDIFSPPHKRLTPNMYRLTPQSKEKPPSAHMAMVISPNTANSGRVSLRTPPVHGRMGIIPGTEQKTPPARAMFGTPSPGGYLADTPYMDMSFTTPK